MFLAKLVAISVDVGRDGAGPVADVDRPPQAATTRTLMIMVDFIARMLAL
jgi:hypothetical protein